MYASVIKRRTERTHREREEALTLFLNKIPQHGVKEAWLIGSMATGKDHPLSDVDLSVKGDFSLKQLYYIRDKVYLRTGVIIQLVLDPPTEPKVRVI